MCIRDRYINKHKPSTSRKLLTRIKFCSRVSVFVCVVFYQNSKLQIYMAIKALIDGVMVFINSADVIFIIKQSTVTTRHKILKTAKRYSEGKVIIRKLIEFMPSHHSRQKYTLGECEWRVRAVCRYS